MTAESRPDVCQIRLDFELFTLAQPDVNGLYKNDSFAIKSGFGEKYPIFCGENEGNHSKWLNLVKLSFIQI